MLPIFYFENLQIPLYGTIIIIAYITGVFLTGHIAYVYNIKKRHVYIVSISCLAGLFVGAKIFYFFTQLPGYIKNFDIVSKNLYDAIYYGFSGYVFYGGLAGALFMIFLYCVRHDISFLRFTNVIVPVIPFIHSLGRIGCFFGGCCYGIYYDGIFCVHFPYNEFIPHLNAYPRFPVQLLESAALFTLFVIMYSHAKSVYSDGFMLKMYLCSYSCIRFMTEFLRGDTYRGIIFKFSTSQWISLIVIIFTLISLKITHHLKKQNRN